MKEFRFHALFSTAALIAAAILPALGCRDPRHVEAYDLVDTTSNEIAVLPPPFTADETTALRTGFAWTSTNQVPEVDSQGRPNLFYALMLVGDREAADFLEITQIYHSPLPLFGDELARWDEYGPGAIDPTGDDHGTFVFAVLSGEMYNVFREEALAGNAPFEAILLRTPSDPSLSRDDGSLDFDRLVDGGFTYGFTPEVLDAYKGRDGATVSPLFGRLARLVHRVVTVVRNIIPYIAARVRPQRDFTMRMRVVGIDAPFYDSSIRRGTPAFDRNIVRRTWDTAATPIVPHGALVEIRSPIAYSRSRLDRNGQARARIPRSNRLRVILRLSNDAAMITSAGLYERHVTIKDAGTDLLPDRADSVHLQLDVRDSSVHGLALLTDSRDFAVARLATDPPRAIVNDGPFDGFEGGASAPCWTFFGGRTLSFGHGRGWSLAGVLAGRIFFGVDMNLRNGSNRSRGVTVHEYGHYLMCHMMYVTSTFDFGRAYGELVREVVDDSDGPISSTSEARIVAEGWADFFAAEVVAGTNYFTTQGARLTGGVGYCDSASTSLAGLTASAPCTEDNWGGMRGTFPGWVGAPATAADRLPIGVVATTLVDAFDRPSLEPTALNGSILWSFGGGASTAVGVPLSDESVQLAGRELLDIVEEWSDASNRLDQPSFFGAIATVAERRFGRGAACEMMALHDPASDCEAIAPGLSPLVTFPAPVFGLDVTTTFASGAPSPVVSARWFSLDPNATMVRVRLERANGAEIVTAELSSTTEGYWASSGAIPFDAEIHVIVTPLDGLRAGVPEERVVHTAPEPLLLASATAGVNSAYVSWTPVAATSYRIVATPLTPGPPASLDTPATAATLSLGGDWYRIQVFSINAIGLVSTVGSNLSDVLPLLE